MPAILDSSSADALTDLQEGQVGVSMAEANLSYSWEYAGNAAKLVVTPLTDRSVPELTCALDDVVSLSGRVVPLGLWCTTQQQKRVHVRLWCPTM